MNITVHYKTDIGKSRYANEDNLSVLRASKNEFVLSGESWDSNTEFSFLCVLDGMGGAGHGADASDTIATRTQMYWEANKQNPVDNFAFESIMAAHRFMRIVIAKNPDFKNMGAVGTAITIQKNKVQGVQIGDTRLYLFRENKISQITEDQTYVMEAIREGKMDPSEEFTNPHRNLVSQAIGPRDELKPASFQFDLQIGDVLLLCSDGLYGMVKNDSITEILKSNPPNKAVDTLVDKANENGGKDNITVILISIT